MTTQQKEKLEPMYCIISYTVGTNVNNKLERLCTVITYMYIYLYSSLHIYNLKYDKHKFKYLCIDYCKKNNAVSNNHK